MSHSTTGESRPPDSRDGNLAQLIRTEELLQARVAAAREGARLILQRARDDAATREAAAERQLVEAQRGAQAEIDGILARRSAELLDQAAQEAARFTRVAPSQIAELADRVVTRLVVET